MAHFLVSIVLLTNALVLVRRAGPTRRARAHRSSARARWSLGRVLSASPTLVLVHRHGRHRRRSAQRRRQARRRRPPRPPNPETSARVHGTMVMIFLAAVLVMVWLLRRDRAPHDVQQRVTLLLVVLVAQAAVGYIQYFNDIPALLVGVHIAGATAVWSATRGALPRDVRTHARVRAATPRRGRRRCLHPPEPPAKLVRCRRRSASTGRGTSA